MAPNSDKARPTIIITLLIVSILSGGAREANYDESKVPKYELPDPLTFCNGTKVETAEQWKQKRRAEILKLFREEFYGKSPGRPEGMTFVTTSVDKGAFNGKATRKEVTVYFTGKETDPNMNMLIYIPNNCPRPAPIFIGLNFAGNHCINSDPGITISKEWVRLKKLYNTATNQSLEIKIERGNRSHRWALEEILERKYALATIYYCDIDPDYNDGFQDGVHPLGYKEGQTSPAADEWGSISAWAWGLSRAMDYFESDSDIDHERVAVMGHSRLGKTALWAGAQDERFAVTISNNSGCGGAALSAKVW